MPAVGQGLDQRLSALGTIRNFVSVMREVSFDEVRDDAERVPHLLVLAASAAAAHRLGLAVTGPEGELAITARELRAVPGDLERFDAVIVDDPERTGAAALLRQRLETAVRRPPVFAFEGSGPDDVAAVDRLRSRIVRHDPERAPAFGRAFPAFRPAAAKAVIDETAAANAQFALVANVPAIVPIVGSLAAAGADFLVLTKNQVMMIFKLGAIFGRDLDDHWGIIQEMIPVVGAGLFWRTVAREAASFIPFAAGTIPKVAIAYAGTLAVGRAADFYYRTNRRPTPEQMRSFYQQAADAVRKLPLPIGKGNEKELALGAGGERSGIHLVEPASSARTDDAPPSGGWSGSDHGPSATADPTDAASGR